MTNRYTYISNIRERIENAFYDLNFDERKHIYTVQGEILPSVTGLVKMHADIVDFEKKLPGSARKAGVSIPEMRLEWKKLANEGAANGTETHAFLEEYTGMERANTLHKEAGVKFFKEEGSRYEIIFRELRMYSRRFGYAGTTDLLLLDKQTRELVLADWKTNKDMFKSYAMLKPPLQYLEAHDYNKYQLQLSYYQLMLDEIGITISDRLLIHLKADGSYKTYNTVDFTEYLANMMESTLILN